MGQVDPSKAAAMISRGFTQATGAPGVTAAIQNVTPSAAITPPDANAMQRRLAKVHTEGGSN